MKELFTEFASNANNNNRHSAEDIKTSQDAENNKTSPRGKRQI